VIRESSRHFVVMDTAPTGHTLLLLDATGSYHRDIVRHAADGVGIVTPMMRLQDPDRTRILIVTLPETTPVLEAARLQEDLRRAGIEPWAWVVNASLAATGTRHPLLAARAATELTEIASVRDAFGAFASPMLRVGGSNASVPGGREPTVRRKAFRNVVSSSLPGSLCIVRSCAGHYAGQPGRRCARIRLVNFVVAILSGSWSPDDGRGGLHQPAPGP
jgi:hypothetical protein